MTNLSHWKKSQHVKVPARTEITDQIDGSNLVKSHSDEVQKPLESKAALSGLAQLFADEQDHEVITKELNKLQKNSKKLPKPIEKPVADRITRTIAYEKARAGLDRWDAVVEKHKVEDTIEFPLVNADEVKLAEIAVREPLSYRIKSDLMMEMEKLEPVKKSDAKKLSRAEERQMKQKIRDEILAQRKELAMLRRKESYAIDKMKRQGKIKSKKYHKVLKKEKLRKELAEFEELQKTDPEAVLERLEMLERSRVEERAHLRHRNTGTWAKNLQVRAKFDRDARQELAQQIEIGRELKKKQLLANDDDESDSASENANEEMADDSYDPFNPWIKVQSRQAQQDAIEDENPIGYRKYWEQRNKNEADMREYRRQTEDVDSDGAEDEKTENDIENVVRNQIPPKVVKLENGFEVEEMSEDDDPIVNSSSIDKIFNDIDETVADQVAEKLKNLRNKLATSTDKKKPTKKDTKNKKERSRPNEKLKFNVQAKRPDLDESMIEAPAGQDVPGAEDGIKSLRKLLSSKAVEEQKEKKKVADSINLDIQWKPKSLKTTIPDAHNDEVDAEDGNDSDEDETGSNHGMIAEAVFADDDIAADFKQEKDKLVEAFQPKDIDLSLPGWGSWTGAGVKEKPKRMLLKFPEHLPRKDDQKARVIHNETVSEKLRGHQVSNLPFPFRSVRDYEASIRAPLTSDFVPETAQRVLTKPSVITKMGAIIQPMDEHVLLQSQAPTIGKKRKMRTDIKMDELKAQKIFV